MSFPHQLTDAMCKPSLLYAVVCSMVLSGVTHTARKWNEGIFNTRWPCFTDISYMWESPLAEVAVQYIAQYL